MKKMSVPAKKAAPPKKGTLPPWLMPKTAAPAGAAPGAMPLAPFKKKTKTKKK